MDNLLFQRWRFRRSQITGFTLIELLVIISIIALLSSVILASLNSARGQSKNARIKQEVLQIRNQIEFGRTGNNTFNDLKGAATATAGKFVAYYGGFVNSGISVLVTDILNINNMTPANYSGVLSGTDACATRTYSLAAASNGLTIFTDNTATCALATKYAIYASYGPTVGSSGYYCLDSLGNSKTTTTGGIPNNPTVASTCQ
ncbi:MAG: hypothetical protein A3B11_02150 [Candidatus Taylorbacteria bacterium RIFCSPLOWO2_01_FULL_44_26]|uniref:Type II secretion system protein GspG C-terminal domain-containing protein n=3 Tax=Candidatus Tayloriibacteriota TaxID=1817919 RepID=A0A1G2MKG6_9BACT|nr:MAG: hypothetical protein A3D50_02270 [Candidatus Taylorbacteria bacterium RIFCSPHIGHO2_02_FULL_44_12]OHA30769.1 MAG: hypothetical protein A3B11_02150 [Candidatus Taylorbacteria bacterium RIFCSPLOWO2_01_FULL_44_26]